MRTIIAIAAIILGAGICQAQTFPSAPTPKGGFTAATPAARGVADSPGSKPGQPAAAASPAAPGWSKNAAAIPAAQAAQAAAIPLAIPAAPKPAAPQQPEKNLPADAAAGQQAGTPAAAAQ